jgi:hypothetical protein
LAKPLLTGKTSLDFRIIAQDSVLVRFSEQDFWTLLACCPAVRKSSSPTWRSALQAYQVEALHREKLVSLGTLAAGLMHELQQSRLGRQARRLATPREPAPPAGTQPALQRQTQNPRSSNACRTCWSTPPRLQCPRMSSIEQSDAEEAMSEWLQAAGVENAFTIGPALVAIGFDREELACARKIFDAGSFSDALNWLARWSPASRWSAPSRKASRASPNW